MAQLLLPRETRSPAEAGRRRRRRGRRGTSSSCPLWWEMRIEVKHIVLEKNTEKRSMQQRTILVLDRIVGC
jgi:hypothetical protein